MYARVDRKRNEMMSHKKCIIRLITDFKGAVVYMYLSVLLNEVTHIEKHVMDKRALLYKGQSKQSTGG